MNDDTATFSSRLGADMTSDDEHKALVFTELSKEMAPTQVPINPLSALVHFRGSTQIASQTKITDAYYFRSRKGGGIIVKGASAHSQFPWLLEQVIIEVTANRGFKPKRLLSDNAGEFIGNVAEKVMTAYNIYFDPIPPSSSQSVRRAVGKKRW